VKMYYYDNSKWWNFQNFYFIVTNCSFINRRTWSAVRPLRNHSPLNTRTISLQHLYVHPWCITQSCTIRNFSNQRVHNFVTRYFIQNQHNWVLSYFSVDEIVKFQYSVTVKGKVVPVLN
jgi:hypothetical protein